MCDTFFAESLIFVESWEECCVSCLNIMSDGKMQLFTEMETGSQKVKEYLQAEKDAKIKKG